jgi:hypothetical protein
MNEIILILVWIIWNELVKCTKYFHKVTNLMVNQERKAVKDLYSTTP